MRWCCPQDQFHEPPSFVSVEIGTRSRATGASPSIFGSEPRKHLFRLLLELLPLLNLLRGVLSLLMGEMWLSCLGLQSEKQYCCSCIIPNALVIKDVIAYPSNCKPRCNRICTSASFSHFLALLRSICRGAKPADLFDEANFTRAVHTIFVNKRSSVCHH